MANQAVHNRASAPRSEPEAAPVVQEEAHEDAPLVMPERPAPPDPGDSIRTAVRCGHMIPREHAETGVAAIVAQGEQGLRDLYSLVGNPRISEPVAAAIARAASGLPEEAAIQTLGRLLCTDLPKSRWSIDVREVALAGFSETLVAIKHTKAGKPVRDAAVAVLDTLAEEYRRYTPSNSDFDRFVGHVGEMLKRTLPDYPSVQRVLCGSIPFTGTPAEVERAGALLDGFKTSAGREMIAELLSVERLRPEVARAATDALLKSEGRPDDAKLTEAALDAIERASDLLDGRSGPLGSFQFLRPLVQRFTPELRREEAEARFGLALAALSASQRDEAASFFNWAKGREEPFVQDVIKRIIEKGAPVLAAE